MYSRKSFFTELIDRGRQKSTVVVRRRRSSRALTCRIYRLVVASAATIAAASQSQPCNFFRSAIIQDLSENPRFFKRVHTMTYGSKSRWKQGFFALFWTTGHNLNKKYQWPLAGGVRQPLFIVFGPMIMIVTWNIWPELTQTLMISCQYLDLWW